MIRFYLVSSIILFLIISCNQSPGSKGNFDLNCVPADTVSEKFHVKYIRKDSIFRIEMKINQAKKLLDIDYSCSLPDVGIPRLNRWYSDLICLENSCGDRCVVYKVYRQIGDSIILVNNYNSALAIDLKNEICIYGNEKKPSEIYIEDLETKNRFSKQLIRDKSYNDILALFFNENTITINYRDGAKEFFSLK